MKITFLIVLSVFTLNVFAQNKQVKLFPFKSAIIEYKYEASMKGTHVKYIDDWGYKQADYIYKQLNFGGNEDKEYEIIILIGPKAYTIDLQKKEVAIGRNETYNYYLLNQERKCTDVSEALIKAEGFKPDGTEEYLGKVCKAWNARKAKKLSWNGVTLKSKINFMTMMVEKATAIKTDVEIPVEKFDIPEDVKYISSDTYQGYSGLELDFSDSEKIDSNTNGGIKIEINTSNLKGCDNFEYFSEKGDAVVIKGENDYNKIDNRLIKSQRQFMLSEKTELPRYSTAIFETNDGDLGKLQITQIDKNGFKLQYVIFNSDGKIKKYSAGTTELLKNDFGFTPDKSHSKIEITPKGKAKCLVLGW